MGTLRIKQDVQGPQMKILLSRVLLLGICLAITAAGYAADPLSGDIASGQRLAISCSACHGAGGNSTNSSFPKLAGLNEKYFKNQMQGFKKGENGGRYSAVMSPLVANLSEQDIADLAAYFASVQRTPATADAKLVTLGEQIYRGGNLASGVPACSACHGPQGHGNAEAGFPALSGQHPEYIALQLHDYRTGKRSNSVADIMEDVARMLTESEITAVASYAAGLH